MSLMQAGCQCGQLTAKIVDGAEAMTVVCHCLDCQRRSGSPFGPMAYFATDAVTLAGEAIRYKPRHPRGRDSEAPRA